MNKQSDIMFYFKFILIFCFMQVNILCIWAVSLGGSFVPYMVWFGARIVDRRVETIDRTWPSCSLQLRWYIFLHRIVKTIFKNLDLYKAF